MYEGLSLNPPSIMSTSPIRTLQTRCIPPRGATSIFLSDNCFTKTLWIRPGSRRSPIRATLRRAIPSSIPQFLHTRPVLDWNHGSAITRTPIYGPSGDAQIANVGDPGSPVSGTPFRGNCAIGGTWYTGTNFPAAYQNLYYFADWGQGLINTLTFDANNKPVALGNFATARRRRCRHGPTSCRRHPLLHHLRLYRGGAQATFLYRQSDADRSCLRGSILWPDAAGGAVQQQRFVRSRRTADHLLVELWRRFAGEHAGQPRTHLYGPARRADGVCSDADGDRHRQLVGANDVDHIGKQHAAERDDHQPGECTRSIRRSTKPRST